MANVTNFTVSKGGSAISGITKLKLPANNYDDVDNTVAGDAAIMNNPHPLNKWEGGSFSTYDKSVDGASSKTTESIVIVVTYDTPATKTYTGLGYFKVSPAEVEASGSVNGLFDVEIVYGGNVAIT